MSAMLDRISALNPQDMRNGILCPKCCGDTSVIDSRGKAGNVIRRRRICIACHHRISTWEIVSERDPTHELLPALRQRAKELRDMADRLEAMATIDPDAS